MWRAVTHRWLSGVRQVSAKQRETYATVTPPCSAGRDRFRDVGFGSFCVRGGRTMSAQISHPASPGVPGRFVGNMPLDQAAVAAARSGTAPDA
jgi:hypothetical protein